MIDLLTNTYNLLKADASLASLMGTVTPNLHIYTGRVDIVREQAQTLELPMLTIKLISESFRTVPLTARDSRIQIDIWSQNSEMEASKIYERVAEILNYDMANINNTHIFWQRGDGLSEQFESEANIFHWTFDMVLWSR